MTRNACLQRSSRGTTGRAAVRVCLFAGVLVFAAAHLSALAAATPRGAPTSRPASGKVSGGRAEPARTNIASAASSSQPGRPAETPSPSLLLTNRLEDLARRVVTNQNWVFWVWQTNMTLRTEVGKLQQELAAMRAATNQQADAIRQVRDQAVWASNTTASLQAMVQTIVTHLDEDRGTSVSARLGRLAGWLGLVAAFAALVLWFLVVKRYRPTPLPAFGSSASGQPWQQELQTLQRQLQNLKQNLKQDLKQDLKQELKQELKDTASKTDLDQALALLTDRVAELAAPVVAPASARAEAGLPPSPTLPPQTTVPGPAPARRKLGEVYADFCRSRAEYLLADFIKTLAEAMPGAEMTQVFLAGGAHELYFTDGKEANPQCYWRVTVGQKLNYLLPRPAGPGKFEALRGFAFDEARPPVPGSLRTCQPAVLVRAGQRWEVSREGGGGLA